MDTIDEEEMKELLAEEMAKYEDEGYFKRLFKMFAGLGRPHASREYKEAVIELQRQIAPLLGLLGTVIGFIKTVLLLNSEEIVSRAALLDATMEALVAAAIGLAIAIPVAVMYGSLKIRMDRLVTELEAAAATMVGYLATGTKEPAK